LLRLIAIADGRPWAEAMAEQLGVHVERVEYHLQRLQATDYIERHFGPDTQTTLASDKKLVTF